MNADNILIDVGITQKPLINPNLILRYNFFNNEKDYNGLITDALKELEYENKNKVMELVNPINFFLWLVVSFKDIF